MKYLPRLILVPRIVFTSFVALYAGMMLFPYAARALWPLTFPVEELNFDPVLHLLLGFFMAFAGLSRLTQFHPVFNKFYTHWLLSTPWNPSRPLPLGPLHIVWQDLLLLAGAFALDRFHLGRGGEETLIIWMATYLVTAAFSILLTRTNGPGILLWALLPACFLVAYDHWLLLAFLAAIYPIAFVALRMTLPHFPWKVGLTPPLAAGWPFQQLAPEKLEDRVSPGNGILISLMLGWWAFCLAQQLNWENTDPGLVHTFFLGGAMLAATARLITYCGQYWPPISIFGRIATGRLIIPRHDVVYVAMFVTLAAGVVEPALSITGMSFQLVAGISTAAILLPALNIGPSLARWHLTGEHRIIPQPGSNAANRPQQQRQQFQIDFSR